MHVQKYCIGNNTDKTDFIIYASRYAINIGPYTFEPFQWPDSRTKPFPDNLGAISDEYSSLEGYPQTEIY